MEGAQGRAPALGFGVIISLWPLERQGRSFLFVMPVNRTCAILIIEFAILVLTISLTIQVFTLPTFLVLHAYTMRNVTKSPNKKIWPAYNPIFGSVCLFVCT